MVWQMTPFSSMVRHTTSCLAWYDKWPLYFHICPYMMQNYARFFLAPDSRMMQSQISPRMCFTVRLCTPRPPFFCYIEFGPLSFLLCRICTPIYFFWMKSFYPYIFPEYRVFTPIFSVNVEFNPYISLSCISMTAQCTIFVQFFS